MATYGFDLSTSGGTTTTGGNGWYRLSSAGTSVAESTGTAWTYPGNASAMPAISATPINWHPYQPALVRSAEEVETAREYAEKVEREKREAEERAEKLLVENLDEEQRQAYRDRKVVPIATARAKYLIKKGKVGNVVRLNDQGREAERFCVHPITDMPDQDVMLAQLLWLRWCEDDFLRVANRIPLAA